MAFVVCTALYSEHQQDVIPCSLPKYICLQVKRIQDPKTLWYQVLDKSGEKGNYVESSCSTMFVYALFKAVRKGYIDKSYLKVALKGYQGILDNFIEVDKDVWCVELCFPTKSLPSMPTLTSMDRIKHQFN